MQHETTDIYLVAALFSLKAKYAGVDRADRKSQKFLFHDPIGVKSIIISKDDFVEQVQNPTYEQIKLAYETSTLWFPPDYNDTLRKAKRILYT